MVQATNRTRTEYRCASGVQHHRQARYVLKEQYPVTAHAPNFDFWTGCRETKRCEESKVAFHLAKLFSDLDNPDCLDFRVSRNKNSAKLSIFSWRKGKNLAL